jgi:hypothetical protein
MLFQILSLFQTGMYPKKPEINQSWLLLEIHFGELKN